MSKNKQLQLNNILYTLAITKNLQSFSQFAKDNSVFFEFHSTHCYVKDSITKEVVMQGVQRDGLYQPKRDDVSYFLSSSFTENKSQSVEGSCEM